MKKQSKKKRTKGHWEYIAITGKGLQFYRDSVMGLEKFDGTISFWTNRICDMKMIRQKKDKGGEELENQSLTQKEEE